MNCCKYIVKNTSDLIANINFKKCDDKAWYYEFDIEPNEIKEVWLEINSYSTEFDTIEILSTDCNYTNIVVSPTHSGTPPVTPSNTPTPSITGTPPVTPTFTPTPSITGTPPVTPTHTPTPTSPPENLKLTFNVSFDDVSFYVRNLTSVNFDMVVDWGDGTPNDTFTGADNYSPYHTYNAIGIFTAVVTFNNRTQITSFSIQNMPLIDIKGLEGFPSLKTLYLNENQLTGFTPQHPLSSVLELINLDDNQVLTIFNPQYPLSTHLSQLELRGNAISNFNPTQPLPSSITFLDLSYNQITSFNPTQILPSNLTQLDLSHNSLTAFTPTQTIPSGLNSLYLHNNSLDIQAIENSLDYLSGITWSAPVDMSFYNQTTGACIPWSYPAYQSLVSDGWSISADYCYLNLLFDSWMNADALVGDATHVNDWNTFFNLPALGQPFSGVTVNGNLVSLLGGLNITTKYQLFGDYTHLLEVYDYGGVIVSLDEETFGGPLETSSITNVYLPGVIATAGVDCYASYGAFQGCRNLTDAYLPKLQSLGVNTFLDCVNLTGLTLDFNNITQTTCGEFRGASSISNLNLPNLTYGGVSTFGNMNCSFNLPSLVEADYLCFQNNTTTTFNLPSLKTAGSYCFESCRPSIVFDLPSLTGCGEWCFYDCRSATTFNLQSMINLGGTVGDNGVFDSINTNHVTLTIPSALLTCNSGLPDGDIIYLTGHSPTTIITV
jgi:Leucine-rich repeat (LRR) protein